MKLESSKPFSKTFSVTPSFLVIQLCGTRPLQGSIDLSFSEGAH